MSEDSKETKLDDESKFIIDNPEECKNLDCNHKDDEEKPYSGPVSLEYKVKVLAIASAHPEWDLKTLQANGCRRLKKKVFLLRWKREVEGGDARFDCSKIKQSEALEHTETRSSEQTLSENVVQKVKKGKKNYCSLCEIQCTGDKNYKDHVAGRKHLKKLSLSECPLQQNSKQPTKQSKKHVPNQKRKQQPHHDTKQKSKVKDDPSKNSSVHHIVNSVEKNQNIENCVAPDESTAKAMNHSNKSHQNNKYTSPDFENRYEKHDRYYSDNYRNRKNYYNDQSYNDNANWNSYSNYSRRGHSHNFNYRSRDQYYSRYHYDASRENDYFSKNNPSCYPQNLININFNESSNSRGFDQHLESEKSSVCERFETPNIRNPFSSHVPPSKNPFKQYYSEDADSSLKSPNEELGTESNIISTSKSPTSSKDDASASKKSLSAIISASGAKRARVRSRSLSSSGSDKARNSKTDQTESEESEEQRIQEWTNTLLETNHNQITRLINPSNHKEKAAVNHLITKFSKSKRKEIFTKTLKSNPSDLTDNDDGDMNNEEFSVESVIAEDDEISVISDSKVKKSCLEQILTSFSTPCSSKTSSSATISVNEDQNCVNSIEPNKSPANQSSKTYSKNHGTVKDDGVASNRFSPNKGSPSSSRRKEKYVKRKSAGSDEKTKKKQRTSSLKILNTFSITETDYLNKGEATPESVSCPPDSTKTPNQDSSVSDIKEEVMDTFEGTAAESSNSTSNQNKNDQNLVFDSNVSVDTLIELFASGNVKVKEEFNDPVMDVLKEISPDELINACTNNSFNASEGIVNEANASSVNRRNSGDILSSPASVNAANKNCVSPVILGSAAFDNTASAQVEANVVIENVSSPSVFNPVLPKPSTSINSELQNGVSQNIDVDKSKGNSSSGSSESTKTKVELPQYFNKLIKQLQDINSKEELVKGDVAKTDSKINELTSLLEDWKRKKKKLHEQEEELRKQRGVIIKLMQDAVETDGDDDMKESPSSSPKNVDLLDQHTSKAKDKCGLEAVDAFETLPSTSSSISSKQQKQKEKGSSEFDEITILPSPHKQPPPEIIICDDEESVPLGNRANDSRHEMNASVSSKTKSSVCEFKNMYAHATIINCLVVFEEYMYTCSNDNTAKRFSLKDGSLSVTYLHGSKNVTEVVVEKVQNEALVFTSCSVKVISLFIASSGTKIKCFFPPCHVMSICKGWGKFYSGLANGAVNVYNWKYEEHEIVKTEHPASRIAAAHQGRLHCLVILSSEGNISVRDAETGLLIRCVKFYIKPPSWMCLNNDLAYLSCSEKSLIILDIMSGKVEQRIHMTNYTTGLAVCDDFIFTVAYNGVINCYNKDRMSDKKLFYGAGKNGLTCLHVYNNCVFTGNRKGLVAMFRFDPNSSVPCEFEKCDLVYGLKEDLEYHVEKDHLKKKKTLACHWRGCTFTFPKQADINDKMNHLKSHIYCMNNRPTNFVIS